MGKLSKVGMAGLIGMPFTGGASALLTIPDAVKAMQPKVPTIKTPKAPGVIDEDAALARERERRRMGGQSSTFSGKRADALSASIGKRMLGGGS